MLPVISWILCTLAFSSTAGVLGRRYHVGYPIAMVVSLIVAAAVLANKTVIFGPFVVPAGVIVASSTFLITDLLSEFWGRRTATVAVWAGFYGLVALSLSLEIAIRWPAAPFALDQAERFNTVLGLTPRIAFASMLAYLVSQHHDVWAFEWWKQRTGGRHLWLRNNASTIVSQLVDSVIFMTVAFYGVLPLGPLILGQWVMKIFIALLDTPFIYFVRAIVNKPGTVCEVAP